MPDSGIENIEFDAVVAMFAISPSCVVPGRRKQTIGYLPPLVRNVVGTAR
jgi:hypothetical protein